MEQFNFPYKGNSFTVKVGGIDAPDTIEVQIPGDSNKYKDELGDVLRLSKAHGQVVIAYKEEVISANPQGNVERAGLHFHATGQETFPYFYDMVCGTHKLGTTLDKMIIDGLLIHKHGLQQGVFGHDGKFYYPIHATYSTTDNFKDEPVLNEDGTQATNPDGTLKTTKVLVSKNLTIVPSDPLTTIDSLGNPVPEVYTYTLVNSGLPANTTGVFNDLPVGEYQFLVESPKSMPYIETILI